LDYIEPIYCLKKEKKYYILDGTHRTFAIKELGFKEILVEYDD
jgi:ParB-like chromosome segregation protein Spo0J